MPLPLPRHADKPVYREILAQAFRAAWQERRYWPLALFASLLLTAGSYDVIFRAVDATVGQSDLFAMTGGAGVLSTMHQVLTSGVDLFTVLGGIQVVIVMSLLLLALLVFSCICQGALVYALGATKRGSKPTLKQALRVGGGAFWPVAALNALILTTLWILRFLMAFTLYLAVEHPTSGSWLLYLGVFLVFVAVSFTINVVHVFALNALVLQGTPVAEAFVRGYDVFKKNWVIVIETTLILFAAAIGVSAALIILTFIATIPLLAAAITAAATSSYPLFYGTLGFGMALFLFGSFAAVSFLTQLQYATWTFLYRRLGEGGAMPKLHRWFRSLFGITAVPQR